MALLHVNYFSNVLGMHVDMDVILPEQTKAQIGMTGCQGKTNKVLYLLHGMSDDHSIWQRRTSIERYAAQYNLAIIMPNAHLSWYTDMAMGLPYYTFFSQELPQIVHNMFPSISQKREDTFVAGLSMGGYGALKLGLHESQRFSKVGALSSACDIVRLAQTASLRDQDYWTDILGDINNAQGSFNDLFYTAEQLKKSGKELPEIYMWCGTEDFLFEDNKKIAQHLKDLNYPLTFETSSGDHGWGYWDDKIQTVLAFLFEGGE